LGIDRTLVAIDCRRVRLCFILDFWRMIAAASIELILNPLDREGIQSSRSLIIRQHTRNLN
jgi:hypothetical protein